MIEFIEAAVAWFAAHWVELGALQAGLIQVATLVTALTPSKADDTWLRRFIRAFSLISKDKSFTR
jgi:hypothetical protein